MVDGTFAQQARTAFDRLANNSEAMSSGPGGDVIGGPKDDRGGHSQGRGNVHRTGIVGQVERTSRGHFDELGERRFAGQVRAMRLRRPTMPLRTSFAELLFVLRTKDGDVCPNSRASRIPVSAKRSGNHCFAVPKAAPGLIPTTRSPRPRRAKWARPAAAAASEPDNFDSTVNG